MAVSLMTVSEYARHRGCDEKAVRKALAEGRISRIGTDRRCIDPEVADIQWAKNTRARGDSTTKAGKGAPPASSGRDQPPAGEGTEEGGEDDYRSNRARRERADAQMAELDLAKAMGKVLDRESALRAVFTKFRELRDSSMSLGRRIAPVLAPMTDAREIRIAIDRAQAEIFETFVRRSLQSLVDQVSGVPVQLPAEVRDAPPVADKAQPPAQPQEGAAP
jgi:hypothetical protein